MVSGERERVKKTLPLFFYEQLRTCNESLFLFEKKKIARELAHLIAHLNGYRFTKAYKTSGLLRYNLRTFNP